MRVLTVDEVEAVSGASVSGEIAMTLAIGWAGTVAGAAAGTMVAPGAGTIVGGLVGFGVGSMAGVGFVLATSGDARRDAGS